MTTMPMREQNARRFMGIAATLGVLGVAFNLNTEDSTLPKLLAVAAVVSLVWSIHRFGRLGADEPLVFEEPDAEPAPKKKKKKKKKTTAEAPISTPPSDDSSTDAT